MHAPTDASAVGLNLLNLICRFWDDWLRLPEQRGTRSCVYPEVNRVYTFGEEGASGYALQSIGMALTLACLLLGLRRCSGQHFDKYLRPIKLNTEVFDYATVDLGYLVKVLLIGFCSFGLRSTGSSCCMC